VLGILQRYVMGEVLRSFFLALMTVTSIIVLFMVMIEASKLGLSPGEILSIVPYMIPGSLPYTIPVSLLFSVTVVYGRLAGDNEIVAIKSAGLSTFTVLRPTLMLGLVLSGLLAYLSYDPIPRATHRVKEILFSNFEDLFFKVLKNEKQFDNAKVPFYIKVKDVRGKTLIEPTFKQRLEKNRYGSIIQARVATIRTDIPKKVVRIYLDGAEVSNPSRDVSLINDSPLEFPLPDLDPTQGGANRRMQEMTIPEMSERQVELKELMLKERKRWAMATSLGIGLGAIDRIQWPYVRRSFNDYNTWQMEWRSLETEKHQRIAIACGSLFFVLLGAPVGIRFARSDFLSAFITCFVPIIVIYYPLVLFGTNLGKDGMLPPAIALWMGNLVLFVLSGFVIPSVLKN